ncbi:uncharacterized protein LOC132628438 [Lycium barbarum]|uniref:uncharacterized protein LOC132628438 n=1 Tax=Lycium barbarum TaxID=112863 RepID=UPI00293EBC1F|nr:uncharacterized protein LOC132628438 [Lycium barbarum]
MSTTPLLLQKSPTPIPKMDTHPKVGQSFKKSSSVTDKPIQSKEKEKAAPSAHCVLIDDVSTSKSDDVKSLREELNQFKQEVLAEFKKVFTELKDLRKVIDENFEKVLEHVKGNQDSEKGGDSETHVPLPDGNVHQAVDDYMDHGDGIHMETDTGDVHSTKIVEGGDLSGEPKTSVEHPADQTGKDTVEEKKHSNDSNNFEVIAQVLANTAESEMANEQVQEEKTEKNTSSTVLEEPQATVSSSSRTDHVPVFDKKYPFQQDSITGPLDVQIVDEYRNWLRNGLLVSHDSKKNYEDHYKTKMPVFYHGVKFNFGITIVDDKNWFYLLTMDGQLWNDEKIDVVHHAYHNVETQTNVPNEEQVLCEYVKVHRLIANVLWHTVDNVLIPVNIKEENHWLLVVLSFKDRRLYVYNSYQAVGHNAVVRNEITKLATLLPHFLHLAGFCVNKKSIDLVKDLAYADKGQIDILEVIYVENLPHQPVGSTDCGVFVAAYVEYLTSGERIPDVIDAHMQRMRYGALLWDYAERKVADNAESDNEVLPRPIRPAIDYDTVDAIDV